MIYVKLILNAYAEYIRFYSIDISNDYLSNAESSGSQQLEKWKAEVKTKH